MIISAARDLRRRFEQSRLSTKILVLSGFTTILPLLLLTLALYLGNSRIVHDQSLSALQGTATSQAAEIDAQLTAWPRQAAVVAVAPGVRAVGTDAANPAAIAAATAALSSSLRLDPAFQAALVADPGGHLLASTE